MTRTGIERAFPAVFSAMSQVEANEYVGVLIGTKSAELVRRAQLLGCNIPCLLGLVS